MRENTLERKTNFLLSSERILMTAINKTCRDGFSKNCVCVVYDDARCIPDKTREYIRDVLNLVNQ